MHTGTITLKPFGGVWANYNFRNNETKLPLFGQNDIRATQNPIVSTLKFLKNNQSSVNYWDRR